jgi:glucose-6-phosphate 1-dehydrogenase
VETFVALRLFVDNWRWAGVPFYVRAGKALARNATEIRLQFRAPPHVLFAAQCGSKLDANSLTLRLQPQEGISLHFNGKVPGAGLTLRPVRMHFSHDTEFGAYTPEAYERLLLDAMSGDATLFARRDEVEQAWKFIDPIEDAWHRSSHSPPLCSYKAGSWGPREADELIERDGRSWRRL